MRVFVAGHNGLVGSEVVKRLEGSGHDVIVASKNELDLRDRGPVFDFISHQRPEGVIIAAAVVGGIKANMEKPVNFLSDNLQIQTNLIDACHHSLVPKVIFLGSSCIYPKHAEQPIKETSLLTGPLEETNEAYALAKIAGVKLIRSYNQQYGHKWLSLMPTNVYGEKDNFLDDDSHVIPALIRKIILAKQNSSKSVELWGTGNPLREFIHASDLADAIAFLLEEPTGHHDLINVGTGEEVTIRELAQIIAEAVTFRGDIVFDHTMPDGTPRKVLDSSFLGSMDWSPKVKLRDGISMLITNRNV